MSKTNTTSRLQLLVDTNVLLTLCMVKDLTELDTRCKGSAKGVSHILATAGKKPKEKQKLFIEM